MECLASQGENKTQVNIQSERKANNRVILLKLCRGGGQWGWRGCREVILQDNGCRLKHTDGCMRENKRKINIRGRKQHLTMIAIF